MPWTPTVVSGCQRLSAVVSGCQRLSADGAYRRRETGSGPAEGPVGAEVLGCRTRVAFESRSLVVWPGEDLDQASQRGQVVGDRGLECLFDEVVARDVHGVHAVHDRGVRAQRPPPFGPGVEPCEVEEQTACRLGVAPGRGAQLAEEAGVVDVTLPQQ